MTGAATSTSTPMSEPTKAPAWTWSSASTEMRRNGAATKGTTASSPAAQSTTRLRPATGGAAPPGAEAADRRVAVGEAPADPVSDAQGDEHRRDRVRPHDRGGAEPRGQQPSGRDLGAEGRGPDDGGEDLDAAPRHPAHPGRFVRNRG